jgi:DNA modification methylase
MQSEQIIKLRKKESAKKKLKESIYDTLMFQQIPKPDINRESDFVLSHNQIIVDQILQQDSRNMHQVNSDVVSLIITSPPYNVNKNYSEYSDQNGLEEYLEYLDEVWKECYRVLRPGGRLCINIANLGRKPYLPLGSYITQHLLAMGFFMRGEIIWNKGSSVGGSTSWGSWLEPSNPTLRDIHEYILIFSKQTNKLKKAVDSQESNITKEEYMEFDKSIWTFATEKPKLVGHPAPFPIELPHRLIKLYSYPGDLILDPDPELLVLQLKN